MRLSRFVPIILLALMLSASVFPQVSANAEVSPIGWMVRDVTNHSDCVVHGERYAEIDPSSGVAYEWVESCPPGSVLETIVVYSEDEAESGSGVFVAYTGNVEDDEEALQEAKAKLSPPEPHESQSQMMSCNEGGWSKTASFYAYDPGLTVYYKVYYWQTTSCSGGVSTTEIMINPSGTQRFAKSLYYGQQAHHGCAELTTYYISHPVYIYGPLGYLFTNETRSGSYIACTSAWGTSYTGSVYLTTP